MDLIERERTGNAAFTSAFAQFHDLCRSALNPQIAAATSDTDGAPSSSTPTFSQHGGPEHLYHYGFTYLIHEDMQFDVHYGLGLNNNAPESFVAEGVSFRFNTH